MIVATHKCGCPPVPGDPKFSFGPCSCSAKKEKGKSGSCATQPPRGCCAPPPSPQPFACCPIKPSAPQPPEDRVVSEIAQKGVPYKEIEALFNNNRVLIRTQNERVPPEFDPPCECSESPEHAGRTVSGSQVESSDDPTAGANRTVALFPEARLPSDERNIDDDYMRSKKPIDQEENPNIFLLRVKKQCIEGDKKINLDVEFKTPRPWSKKRQLEAERMAQSGSRLQHTIIDETSNVVKRKKPRSKKRRRR